MSKKVYVVFIQELSDPYEPPLTRVDAVFSTKEKAEEWLAYRNGHVTLLADREDGEGYSLDADRNLGRAYGFALGTPSLYHTLGDEPWPYFELQEYEVRDDFDEDEYPDAVI